MFYSLLQLLCEREEAFSAAAAAAKPGVQALARREIKKGSFRNYYQRAHYITTLSRKTPRARDIDLDGDIGGFKCRTELNGNYEFVAARASL